MDFGDEECFYIRFSIIIKGVCKLEFLKIIVVFSFFLYNIKNRVYKFSFFCVVFFSLVVFSIVLFKDKVVWFEDLFEWVGFDGIYGFWF